MARTPRPYVQSRDEPTIIVDPSLYEPPPVSTRSIVADFCIGAARGVLVAALASAAVLGIAHLFGR